MNKTLVIIATYNAMTWIKQCLDSIDMLRYDVMVVDNCSQDETCEYINEHYSSVILIKNNDNLGFGRANNVGFRYAIKYDYEYVFLLNQDAWLKPETIEQLIAAHRVQPEYWILSPIQMNTEENGIEYLFNLYCLRSGIDYARLGVQDIDYPNAALWLLPVQTIKTVGCFDPIFPHYGEDTDFTARVRHFGGKVGVLVGCEAYHEHTASKSLSQEMQNYRQYISYLFILKNAEHYWAINNMVLLSNFVRKALRGLVKRDKTLLRALKYAMQRIRKEYYNIHNHYLSSTERGAFL